MPALHQLKQRAKSFVISSLRCFDSHGSKAWACIELQLGCSSDDTPCAQTGRQFGLHQLSALGNYQGHVVGLLMRTELLDLIHNRSKQYR